jgi:hypothetical protein
MKHTWTGERCKKELREIDRRIDEIFKQCETIDSEERHQDSLVKLQKDLQDQKQLKSRVAEILKGLKEQDRKALNTTDPESARIRNGGQIETGYNCQAVVDERHGLIVHSDVVSQSNDGGLFSGQIQSAQETLGKVCQTACADAGFGGSEDLKKTLEQGVDVVVPVVRHSDFRDQFTYDPRQNVYRCPEGHILKYTGDHQANRHHIYWMSDASVCQRCPRFGTCTKSTQGRRIVRPFAEEVREHLEARMKLPDARALLRKRKMRVEHPFGHIKHNLGMRSFLLRGLIGVRAEAALAATAFNLIRMINLIGIQSLLQTLDQKPA